MSVKIYDTMTTATSNFPLAYAEKINIVKEDGSEADIQTLYNNGELSGGDTSIITTEAEYLALPEEQKLNNSYYLYDIGVHYKNGVAYSRKKPIQLTMEEYKALGEVDPDQEYIVSADEQGILLGAEDIGYNNAVSKLPCTTVQGAIDKVNSNLGELSETSSQILTPLFSEQTGNQVILYKMGKLRMILPVSIYPSSRPVMTYFDAYQLPEDSYPPNKIGCLMNTADNVVVDLTVTTREEGGKIQMRYRGEAHYVWIPSLVWIVD